MKHYRLIVVVIAVFAAIVSCTQPFSGDGASDFSVETPDDGTSDTGDGGAVAAVATLPPDQTSDVRRVAAASFTFETVFPVSVNLEANLYEVDESGHLVGDEPSPADVDIIATLINSDGTQFYSAKFGPDGRLAAVVYLPSAPEDVTLTISAAGFRTRSFTIPDMVQLSELNRVISISRVVSGDGTFRSLAMTGLEDSDGDGVPDVYDAYPSDPSSSFELNVPAEGQLTVAFEDLFGLANAGDADYNDFVAAYSITEALTDSGLVTSITVDADAVTKLAGYNHKFGIRIDSFFGAAELTGTYIDSFGRTRDLGGIVEAPAEIVLFENSRWAVGKSATFTLTFETPQSQGVLAGDEGPAADPLPDPPFNPFAIVLNTGHDIHLIGREPLTEVVTSINPDDTFVDEDGFPWALLVPDDWINPEEGQRIETPYPRFTLWRESEGEDHTDWYLHYYDPYTEPLAPVATITPTPQAGDPVIYPESRTYQLLVNADDGTVPAYYRSVGPLPEWITLTEATGEVIVDSMAATPGLDYGEQRQETVAFYSSDNANPADDPTSGSTLNEPFSATFMIEREESAVDAVVYVAGYYNNGTKDVAAYWLDGAKFDLLVPAASSGARAYDIYVAGGDVYVAGYYVDSDTRNQVAAYWLNGDRVDLALNTVSSSATGIAVDGSDVVVSGSVIDGDTVSAVVWRNGVRQTLYDGARYTEATGVAMAGQQTHVSGYVNDGTTLFASYATRWQAGSLTDLSGAIRSHGWDIEVSSTGDVYVAGDFSNGVNYASAYWVNQNRVPLYSSTTTGQPSSVTGISLAGGVVYTAGYFKEATEIAAYWAGTSRVTLPGGSLGARAKDIAVDSGTVYVVGNYIDTNRRVAVIWVDSALSELYDSGLSGKNSEALSIAVVRP